VSALSRIFLLFAMLLVLAGCVVAPIQEMSNARQAIKAGKEAGVDNVRLEEAERHLESAEAHMQQRKYRLAREEALLARDRAIKARESISVETE